jgi:tetratricopeptide (TPR) repeat protein
MFIRSRIKVFAMACLAMTILAGTLTACREKETGSVDELLEARQAFSRKEFLDAERQYERYLQHNPEGTQRWEAWERLVDIALSIRKNERLATDILEAMALEYNECLERGKASLERLGRVYEANHRWDQALTVWRRLQDFPSISREEQGELQLKLAKIYQLRGQNDLTVASLRTCLDMQTSPKLNALCLYELAQVFMMNGQAEQAKIYLLELGKMPEAPVEVKVLGAFELADFEEEQGNFQKSLDIFESIKDIYPNPDAVEARIRGLRQKVRSYGPVRPVL